MIRDYQIVSPSLEGVLSESTLSYEGLKRPIDLLRVFDSGVVSKEKLLENKKMLDEYFHDLYGIFMKKLSFFVVNPDVSSEDTVRLQAMLQEMVKVKKMMSN
ncbi:MAG: hypothetical protein WC648_03840 [Candidatus Paceibacterota bacterium]|jgi:hypothetical protein